MGAIVGAEVFPVQKAGEAELAHPLEAAMHGPAFARTHITWPTVNAWRLPDVYLVGDQACVYLANSLLPANPHGVWARGSRKARRPIRWLAGPPCMPLFHLTGTNHENRAHFLLEHLPRFFAARAAGLPLPTDLLLAPGHRHWQARYLEHLGVPEASLIEGTPGTMRAGGLMLVPFLGGEAMLPAPSTLRAMAAEMQTRFRGAAASDSAPVLWISRRDAPDRQLANEEALVAITRRVIGETEVVRLKEHAMPVQLAKLSGCQWVIGAQGQGLHLPFLSAGKRVVILEQGGPNHGHGWDATFRDLAELAGNHSVRFFSGQPSVTRRPGHWEFPPAHFTAQLTRLRQVSAADALPRP